MLHEALDIDGRLFLTLKTLLLKPGALSLEYRNGKRKTYTPPLRLYVVISILFFLLISTLDLSAYGKVEGAAARSEYYPKLMFVLLPIFALILQLLFRSTFYLSNLIFALHLHCVIYLAFAIMLPLEAYEHIYPVFILLQVPFISYLLVYLALALKHFYAENWGKTITKLCALFFIYTSMLGVSFDYILPLL
jgi:hypothetical protein